MPATADTLAKWGMPPGYASMLAATWLMSFAITFDGGFYSINALTIVMLAVGSILSCFWISRADQELESPRAALVLIWFALLAMAWQGYNDPGLMFPMRPWMLGKQAQLAFVALLVTYLPFLGGQLPEPKWLRRGRFALFALVLLAAAVDALRAAPEPRIDVWTVQQAGADVLTHFKNPYTEVHVMDTAPGPRFGQAVPYVYPPTQLYVTLPAYLLWHDVRFAMLASLVLAGFGLRYIAARGRLRGPALLSDAPALMIWLMPKLFYILEQSWIDPVQLMFIVATLAAYTAGFPLLAAVLLGVTLGAKQTMFWAFGLMALMLAWNKKHLALASVVAGALVAPFVWLDFKALKYANFDFVNELPPRPEALTFTNWAAREFGWPPSSKFGFALAICVAVLAVWRFGRSRAGLGVAIAATYAVFFVFNKWAFANYYFLLTGLCALGAALTAFADTVPRLRAADPSEVMRPTSALSPK